jgi:hypothetical protein
MSISESFTKFGGVDYKKGCDKTTVHSYGPVYDTLFSDKQYTTLSVLEIGIETGGSLAALKDYFKNARIYGIDIEDRRFEKYKSLENVHVFIGNALEENTINHFSTTFDVIIEDASHDPNHQKQHFKDYCRFIKKDGVYIIEDVHNSRKVEILNYVKEVGTPLGFECVLVDLTSFKGHPDDNLIICKRQTISS